MSKNSFTFVAQASCAILAIAFVSVASGAPLIGSGANFAIPSPNPGAPPREGAVLSGIDASGFDGSWSAPALAPWVGMFDAVGPVPSGNASPAGTTRYDFTTLPNGFLPAGTFFAFGDVDGGSATNETFILNATDVTGGLLTIPWLDEPLGISGSGTGTGGTVLPNNLPGWDWNGTAGEYTIDGTTVTGGNPTAVVWLESNTDIAYLSVQRTSNFANFGLSAPIPEPSSVVMLVLGAAVAFRRR